MAPFSSPTSWRQFSKATENRSQAAGGVSGSNVQGSYNGLKPLDSKSNGSSPRANSSPMGEPAASSAARSPTSNKASNDNSANGSIQKSSLEQSSSHMPPPPSKPTQSTKEGPSSVPDHLGGGSNKNTGSHQSRQHGGQEGVDTPAPSSSVKMTPHNAPPVARFLPDPSPSPTSNVQDNGGVMTTIHTEMTVMPSPTPINNHAGCSSGIPMDSNSFTSSSIGDVQQAVHLNGGASPLAYSDASKEVLYTTVTSAVNTVPILRTTVVTTDGGQTINTVHTSFATQFTTITTQFTTITTQFTTITTQTTEFFGPTQALSGTANRDTNIGAVVGGAIGCVLLLAGAILALCPLKRKRRHIQAQMASNADPFPFSPMTSMGSIAENAKYLESSNLPMQMRIISWWTASSTSRVARASTISTASTLVAERGSTNPELSAKYTRNDGSV